MNENKNLPVHDGSKLTWYATVKRGVVEASTLGRNHTGRVWPDACDTGFNVVSHRTGEKKLFVYFGALSRSRDIPDVYAHVYRSEDGFEVHVLNT
jgi:hypothetical protein